MMHRTPICSAKDFTANTLIQRLRPQQRVVLAQELTGQLPQLGLS